jgi:hypothetical protein
LIRPSALQLAEHCGYASVLAAQYPESSPAARRGQGIHAQIADGKSESPEARAALRWLKDRWEGQRIAHEVPVRLLDPETDEEITAGTADVIIEEDPAVPAICVVDWKTGKRANVADADDNLQLLTYGLAASMQNDAQAFRVVAVYLDGDDVSTDESRVYHAADWWPILARVRAAAYAKPEASPGPHCTGCWQRRHCPSWILPAGDAPAALAPIQQPGGLTVENAPDALMMRERLRDMLAVVDGALEAHTARFGPIRVGDKQWGPVTVNGRRSGPSLDQLEAMGLGHLIKQGRPTTRHEWRKAK